MGRGKGRSLGRSSGPAGLLEPRLRRGPSTALQRCLQSVELATSPRAGEGGLDACGPWNRAFPGLKVNEAALLLGTSLSLNT